MAAKKNVATKKSLADAFDAGAAGAAKTADVPEEPKAAKLNAAGWRDPKSVYAADDNSIDARMWRLEQDLQRQGAR